MAEVPEGVPYQQGPQVAQLLAERVNADALGLTDRVTAVDKQLKQLGYKEKAAKSRKAAAADDDDSKSEPPKERSSKPAQTADKK